MVEAAVVALAGLAGGFARPLQRASGQTGPGDKAPAGLPSPAWPGPYLGEEEEEPREASGLNVPQPSRISSPPASVWHGVCTEWDTVFASSQFHKVKTSA